jgi:hypothetical protein
MAEDRFSLRVRQGYLGYADAARQATAEAITAGGGGLESWSWLGGAWSGEAVATFSSHGAAKLATDLLEQDGATVDVQQLIEEQLTSEPPSDDPTIDQLMAAIEPGNAEWRSEAGWWEDWSGSTGTAGEIERIIDLGVDELSLDGADLGNNAPLGWKWVKTWVWDTEAQAAAGPSADPPDGVGLEGGGWKMAAVRIALRAGGVVGRVYPPVAVAATIWTVGDAIKTIYDHRHVSTDRVKPHCHEAQRRQYIRVQEIRDRLIHERTPRGEYFRHYHSRVDRYERYVK